MKVVYQWMKIHFIKMCSPLLVVVLFILNACNPAQLTPGGQRTDNVVNADGSLDNKAYIYSDNPIILSKNPNFGPSVDMARFINKRSPQVVTSNNQLTGNCLLTYDAFTTNSLADCIISKGSKDSTTGVTARKSDRTYIFSPNSSEFYESNTLYHLMKGTNTFFDKLSFAYNQLHFSPGNSGKPKSIPSYLQTSNHFWFKAIDLSTSAQLFKSSYLTSYALCNKDKNASFSPAGPELCFGYHSSFPGVYFAQDPSVIYHELGHALVSVMMNLRNGTAAATSHQFRSNLGSYGYEESGAMNEGFADYYSYVIPRAHSAK